MSRPSHNDIANALGVEPYRVSQLVKRGMPVSCVRKARHWFEQHGMRHIGGTPHGQHKR